RRRAERRINGKRRKRKVEGDESESSGRGGQTHAAGEDLAVMARKYLIETFGCQMNVHDSERMAGLLEQAGYEMTEDAEDADVVVINTCSVRERAEEKLYTRLGELRQLATEQ